MPSPPARPTHRPLFLTLSTAGLLFGVLVLALIAPEVPQLIRDTADRGFIWMLSIWLQETYVA